MQLGLMNEKHGKLRRKLKKLINERIANWLMKSAISFWMKVAGMKQNCSFDWMGNKLSWKEKIGELMKINEAGSKAE